MKLVSTGAIALVGAGSSANILAQSQRPPQAPPPLPNADAYYRLGPASLPREGLLPDMLRWLWRDQPVSTDPRNMEERSFREPPSKTAARN